MLLYRSGKDNKKTIKQRIKLYNFTTPEVQYRYYFLTFLFMKDTRTITLAQKLNELDATEKQALRNAETESIEINGGVRVNRINRFLASFGC